MKIEVRSNMKKCLDCPYYLGKIKCITDPCIECQSRKTHPFPQPVLISERLLCKKCGSNRFVNDKCVVCGSKLKKLPFFTM